VLGFLYRAAWSAAKLATPLVARGDSKLARSLRGRAGGAAALAGWAGLHRDTSRPLVWFHAASVGEARQAEAVLAPLRAARPDWQAVYTFASASAEDLARRLPADFAGYVPADLAADAARALDALRPALLVFAANDLWPTLVAEARRRGVKLALVSATLAEASSRRGPGARALLSDAWAALDVVGAIDRGDADRLEALGVPAARINVTGDTRHDAAAARAARVDRHAPALRALGSAGRPLLVAGSTWPADERVLLPAIARVRARRPLGLVIAPHEPDPDHLAALERRLAAGLGAARVVRLGALEREVDGGAPADWDVCVVDRVGILADLYATAAIAFVGGGFHAAGLHSVIEPAALGVPVLFGPRWQGSRDARLLLEHGGARAAADAPALAEVIDAWLDDAPARAAAGAAALGVVTAGVGAADRSVQLLLGLMEARSER